MIERFLDLDRKSMEKVVGLVNKSITVATGVAKMKKGTGSGQEGDSANTSAAAKGKDIDGKTPGAAAAGEANQSAHVSVDVLIRIVEDLSRIH